MLLHIFGFLTDYFTNLNAKKIFGGLLVLAGLAILGRSGSSGNPDIIVLHTIGGILVGGVGFIVIYYDMAQDKANSRYSELDTLSKVHKQNDRSEEKTATWHMDQDSDDKNPRS